MMSLNLNRFAKWQLLFELMPDWTISQCVAVVVPFDASVSFASSWMTVWTFSKNGSSSSTCTEIRIFHQTVRNVLRCSSVGMLAVRWRERERESARVAPEPWEKCLMVRLVLLRPVRRTNTWYSHAPRELVRRKIWKMQRHNRRENIHS